MKKIRGIGAAGSAFDWQSKGQGFEPPMLHQNKKDTFRCLFYSYANVTGGSNPGGRERKRECPVDIRVARGSKATERGAEKTARETVGEACGRAPYAIKKARTAKSVAKPYM